MFVGDTSYYVWWKKSCTARDVRNPVNNKVNYQPQLVGAGFLPSSTHRFPKVSFMCNSARASFCTRSDGNFLQGVSSRSPFPTIFNAWLYKWNWIHTKNIEAMWDFPQTHTHTYTKKTWPFSTSQIIFKKNTHFPFDAVGEICWTRTNCWMEANWSHLIFELPFIWTPKWLSYTIDGRNLAAPANVKNGIN